jgi:hypothetical protein
LAGPSGDTRAPKSFGLPSSSPRKRLGQGSLYSPRLSRGVTEVSSRRGHDYEKEDEPMQVVWHYWPFLQGLSDSACQVLRKVLCTYRSRPLRTSTLWVGKGGPTSGTSAEAARSPEWLGIRSRSWKQDGADANGGLTGWWNSQPKEEGNVTISTIRDKHDLSKV